MRWTKVIRVVCSTLAVTAVMASALFAQQRRTTPPAGSWAAGLDAGFANPLGDDDFDAEPIVDAYIEYFSTPHVSWRGMAGFASFDSDAAGVGPTDLDITSFIGNVLYQWEGGTIHPFVTGGIGVYNYDPEPGETDLEPGFNAGGGMNIYAAQKFAIKVEGLFHVTDGPAPDTYLTGTAGARWLWGGR